MPDQVQDVVSKAEAGTRRVAHRMVTLIGTRDVMFDRYAGDNNTKLDACQKLYIRQSDRAIVFPALNLMSFLSAQNTPSAPKRLLDKRKYKDTAAACLSWVTIDPFEIPFLRDGKPIIFGEFGTNNEPDESSGCYIHRCVARLDKGIPNPKVRPVLPLPWSLKFKLTIEQNDEVQEVQIANLFDRGGRCIGIGTFRGVFGKFDTVWEKI